MAKKILKKEQIDRIKKGYFSENLSTTALAKELGCSHNTIARTLKREGLQAREKGFHESKYSVNEDYFDKIDSPDKAYFLGLLYADGYMDEINKGVKLSLQEQDKEILEEFIKRTSFTGSLGFLQKRKVTHSNSYYIQIYNKKFYQKAKSKGLYTKKSLTLKFPSSEIVPEELISHFIRGYFDGDGTVGTYRKMKRVGFIGTKEFLVDLQYILSKKLDLIATKLSPKSKNNTYCFRIDRKRDIQSFSDFIYNNKENLFLKRKHNKLV